MERFIIIYDKLINWGWFGEPKTLQLFIYFLLKANWEEKEWMGQKIKRGQLITGYLTINKDTGLSHQSYRTCLKHLISTGEVTVQPTNKFTLVTIVKYDDYQNKNKSLTRKVTGKLTNEQQTPNNQLTTTNKYNNNTIKQKEKDFFSFENVKLPKGVTLDENGNWKTDQKGFVQ